MSFRHILRVVVTRLLLLLGAAIPGFAFAAYPDHAITLVVPYPPGGTADIMARLVGIELGKELKQSVIVLNRGGAAGNIAAQTVKSAPPDGYTLMLANAPVLAINPHLFKAPGFDPMKDFDPIAPIADTPLFLIENPKAPYHSVREFVEWSKNNPQKATYASGSVGSTTNLAMVLFMKEAGFKALQVPYKGSGPALAALASDEVPIMFELLPSAMGFMNDGRVKPLAVTSLERQQTHPEVPTIAESGYPGFHVSSWFGVVAPAGTPAPVLDTLSAALTTVSSSPQFRERLTKLGAVPMQATREQFARLIQSENVKWEAAVESSGAKVE
jgi:tripartite-type tricarboxylate transporter receptor subunit TctC